MAAFWRLLGKLPRPRTVEAVRTQSLDGWNPWQFSRSPTSEPPIAVPDPQDPSRFRHADISTSGPDGSEVKFASLWLESDCWFYVPARLDEPGAFEAEDIKFEGFWRARLDEESELAWPVSARDWPERSTFLSALTAVEATTERVGYRGFSMCRLCGCRNGHESLTLGHWEWPTGFRHYVEAHDVRPSEEFVKFIMEAGASAVRTRAERPITAP